MDDHEAKREFVNRLVKCLDEGRRSCTRDDLVDDLEISLGRVNSIAAELWHEGGYVKLEMDEVTIKREGDLRKLAQDLNAPDRLTDCMTWLRRHPRWSWAFIGTIIAWFGIQFAYYLLVTVEMVWSWLT